MKQLEYLMSQTGILTKAKKKFIGDKAFYRYLIFLAFPLSFFKTCVYDKYITKKWYNANSCHLSSLFFSCFSNNPHIQNKHFFDFLYLISASLEASPVQVFSVRSFSEKETLRDRNIPSVSNCTPVC